MHKLIELVAMIFYRHGNNKQRKLKLVSLTLMALEQKYVWFFSKQLFGFNLHPVYLITYLNLNNLKI